MFNHVHHTTRPGTVITADHEQHFLYNIECEARNDCDAGYPSLALEYMYYIHTCSLCATAFSSSSPTFFDVFLFLSLSSVLVTTGTEPRQKFQSLFPGRPVV